MLSRYVTELQNLLNDQQGQFFPIPTLVNYINRSRRRIAYSSGCVRVLPPGILTHPQQEVYPFSDWISLVQGVRPQVQSILSCRSIAVSIGPGGWKPVWRRIVFTDFQSRFRIFAGTWYGTISEPGWWAQYGEGTTGAIYMAPIPAQELPMEADLTCIPAPLLTDGDEEIIPAPWDDAVVWWAAVLALLQRQRPQEAQAMMQMFQAEMPFCASVVNHQMIQNTYGATIRSA
jgi:hypothetical protein